MARHLIVSGIVQGVGYRASFSTQAQQLGLSGWVRNRHDGTVEAMVAGDAVALDTLIDWARRGPPLARVDHIAIADAADDAVRSGRFEMLPTV